MDRVKEQLSKLLEQFEKFQPECMDDNTQLVKDCGFDSIRLMSLVVEMEELFGIRVEEDFIGSLYTITFGQLVNQVKKLISEKNDTRTGN